MLRIFSIYEGTTQLQVVAAIRYITNGTYLNIIKEMLDNNEVSEDLKSLKVRVSKLVVELYEQSQLRQGSQQHRGSRFLGRQSLQHDSRNHHVSPYS